MKLKKKKSLIVMLLVATMVILTIPTPILANVANSINTITSEDKALEEALENHRIKDTVDPVGTVVNLFDYWINDNDSEDEKGRFAPDYFEYCDGCSDCNGDRDHLKKEGAQATKDKGINKGHAFKFRERGAEVSSEISEDYNLWTGDKKLPRQGFVRKMLDEKGYPSIRCNPADWYKDSKEEYYDRKNDEIGSLDYLFNPNTSHVGKKSFKNVKGLLQVKNGYYHYDSKENFAEFIEAKDKNEENRFNLYDEPAVYRKNNTDDKKLGQFFPFNKAEDVFETNGNLDLDGSRKMNASSTKAHHFHGLTMTTRFVQKNGGEREVPIEGEHVQYKFTGDDDVWVFIDDVLVADLGGIHDAADLNIDFATGEIDIKVKGVEGNNVNTNIRQQFKNASEEKEKNTKWNEKEGKENTFADNTYHTLRFFYLERGNNEANLKLEFNLITVPESNIVKKDQNGNPIVGAKFELYEVDKSYTVNSTDVPLYTGTTDEKGNLVMKDKETNAPVSFRELYYDKGMKYFVLRESEVPPGYRSAVDTKLHYDERYGLTESVDVWKTGSYAQPKVTTTVPTKITRLDGSGTWNVYSNKTKNSNEDNKIEREKVYAVVFKYTGDKKITDDESIVKDNWDPIVGNPRDGWEILKGGTPQQAIEKKTNKMELYPDGSYKIDIDELPGNGKSYYSIWSKMNPEEKKKNPLKYNVNYYYLDEKGDYIRLDQTNFIRDFSVALYIPNIKNYLVVRKLDESGNPLNGAKFALYKKGDVDVKKDGTYTIKGEAYDTVITRTFDKDNGDRFNGDGYAGFPSTNNDNTKSNVLEIGKYYLIETEAPEGYNKSDVAIPVIVDHSGVYADAGDKSNGVSTKRTIGNPVHSMHPLAIDDGTDATLHDIKVQLQNSEKISFYADSQNLENDKLWYTYSKDFNHYQSSDKDTANNELGSIYKKVSENQRLVSEEGWSRLSVKQCTDKSHCTKTNKTDLGDAELRRLFSTVLVVQVENEIKQPGLLTIRKTLQGINTTDKFKFKVTLSGTNKNGVAANDINGTYGNLAFTNGVAEFELGDGEQKSAYGENLVGFDYKVEEEKDDKYVTVYTNEVGTIKENEPSNVVVTNEFKKDLNEKIDIKVTKVWDDEDNKNSKRPGSVIIELLADGNTVKIDGLDNPIELSEKLSEDKIPDNNEWTYTFKNLPKYDENGKEINYYVTENFVKDYETEITGNKEEGFIITNKYNPIPDPGAKPEDVKTSVKVTKVWNDENNKENKRPKSVTIELFADGNPVTIEGIDNPIELSNELSEDNLADDNEWEYTFKDLPKYDKNGRTIVYSIKEVSVEGYETEITGNMNTGFVVTNTYKPTDPGPGPNPDPDPDPNPGPNPDPDPDPNPGPNPDPDPDPNPGPNPDPDPDPNPGPNPDPNPDKPGKPSNPGNPSNPGETPDTPDDTPRTGDENNLLPWVVLMIASGMGLVMLRAYNKKSKKQ